MSATLKVTQTLTLTLGTNVFSGGVAAGTNVTLTGQVLDRRVPLAASATGVFFDSTTDLPTAPLFVCIEADGEAQVELTFDLAGSVGVAYHVLKVEAGIPLILGSIAGMASDYQVNFAAGTWKSLNKIRVKNAGATTINVRVFCAY
jgi:hypothetical protein